MLHAPGGTRSNPSPLTPLPEGEGRSLRYLGGFLSFLAVVAFALAPNPSIGQAPDGVKKTAPVPRVVRVTPSEATGAVEVSVAINPTNPDHMIAASIARVKGNPSVTNYAYVT